jgi:selenocysteine-specific elongation factor
MDIIAGTAGHIDHGKTALVKALTGTDADRLPEEKQRGITIDLGFAELDLEGVRLGFVDVPGHERFIKNMLAGVGGIDLVMLVIAADKGVMPQTREHFDICRLLEVSAGMIVLTKCDLVDEELLEIVRLEIAELVAGSFLDGAPVLAVSSRTGEGIDQLKTALLDLARAIPQRAGKMVSRLPIDRSFTVKGFGTVVTGTLLSGEIAVGDEPEILPDSKNVRVRGLQTHGKTVETVNAGQRAAVNLGGIEHSEIERGMVLCERGVLRATQVMDAEIEVLKYTAKPLRSRQRVRVHTGTVEALARVQVLNEGGEIVSGEKDFIQLRLEMPVVALPGDRFIIRSYSPQITIAGGRVLDAIAARHRKRDVPAVRKYLQEQRMAADDRAVDLLLRNAGESGLTFSELQARTGWTRLVLQNAIDGCVRGESIATAGEHYIAQASFDSLKAKTLAEIEGLHRREPLARGIARKTLREKVFRHLHADIFKAVLASLETGGKIVQEKEIVRQASHSLELSGSDKILYDRLLKIYAEAGFEVPKIEEALILAGGVRDHTRRIFRLLLNAGEIVKVNEEFYFSRASIDRLIDKLKTFAAATTDRLIDVPKFKEIAGISRKYAIPLLEYFDREKITRRAGDKRSIL